MARHKKTDQTDQTNPTDQTDKAARTDRRVTVYCALPNGISFTKAYDAETRRYSDIPCGAFTLNGVKLHEVSAAKGLARKYAKTLITREQADWLVKVHGKAAFFQNKSVIVGESADKAKDEAKEAAKTLKTGMEQKDPNTATGVKPLDKKPAKDADPGADED